MKIGEGKSDIVDERINPRQRHTTVQPAQAAKG
jgi:hypothetical protein